MNTDYKRYEWMSCRLLFTHGFLPNKHNRWSKYHGATLTTAEFVGRCPMLRLELQSLGKQGVMQVVRKNYVNLTETDELRLKLTIEAFEV